MPSRTTHHPRAETDQIAEVSWCTEDLDYINAVGHRALCPSPVPPLPSGYDPYLSPAQPYPVPAYGPQPYGPPGYGYGFGVDPTAPFGRDPFTGEPLSDKSKVAAGLLQLFLGGFGAGRFYLGSNGIAVAQLITLIIGWLLTIILIGWLVLFGLGIWVVVDAIIIFTGGARDSRGFKLRS